ncbi:MAG: heparinase II/III family protein [Acidobacteria bacterium]|nr:heparinase II/III family protein [Acidobacteriota bacterium]
MISLALATAAAIFPPAPAELDVPKLLAATAHVRNLNEDALRRMVPVQSGLHFVGCPNCQSGRQEGQLVWDPAHPQDVSCRYCRHRYPSPRYPMRRTLEVRNPRGEIHKYAYWEDPAGYRYYFAARRDDLAREYLAAQTRNLALLYVATRETGYARRAALLLERFAEVYPGWCYHYDYPFRQKQIFEGLVPPERFLPGMRTARWTWWAYNDMPVPLLEAYDWIREAGVLEENRAARIERDLFRAAAGQMLANAETYSNMSPRLWGSLVRAGRILGAAEYADAPVERVRAMLEKRFFHDGSWAEGAPSYARQTVNSLRQVLSLRGGGAPPPELERAERALAQMRLPDGRLAPIHDTWAADREAPLDASTPFLLPALGHAALGGGRGAGQWQAHLTWSGGYGHEHADALSLLLFSRGREVLSDLGYTHTRYRAWTLATAAHNTVVIDGRNQHTPGADGALRYFDAGHPRVQAVSADATRAYPELARKYRRTLVAVDGRYLLDWFEVEGGGVHDYFLHGDAGRGSATPPAAPPSSWRPPANEGELARIREPYYAYGFLRGERETPVKEQGFVRVSALEGLTVHFLAQAGDRLYTGTNPAIRGAAEDDALLEKHQRGFFRARREGGASLFVAVVELVPGVTGVTRTPRGVRVRLNDRTDDIEVGEDGLRLAALGYALGPERTARLRAIENGRLLLEDGARPPAGALRKLVTADGWVYPLTEDPGGAFTWDAQTKTLELLRFPLRSHRGEVRVTWRSPHDQ